MSRLGEVLNKSKKHITPVEFNPQIFLIKSLQEQHNYLVSSLPKPKDGCIMKFIKKIFS